MGAAQPHENPQLPRIPQLCALAAAGGSAAEDAVEELLSLHHARFLGFVKRKLGVDFQGKLEAEDILQDTYAQVFRDIGSFQPLGDDSFYHWVAQIIEHRFIDHVRALRRKKRDVSREAAAAQGSKYAELAQSLHGTPGTPSGINARAEGVGAMLACIARLPSDERTVVERVMLRGEHPAAVGGDMGRSEDAVRRLGDRARERLAQLLGRASRYLTAH